MISISHHSKDSAGLLLGHCVAGLGLTRRPGGEGEGLEHRFTSQVGGERHSPVHGGSLLLLCLRSLGGPAGVFSATSKVYTGVRERMSLSLSPYISTLHKVNI